MCIGQIIQLLLHLRILTLSYGHFFKRFRVLTVTNISCFGLQSLTGVKSRLLRMNIAAMYALPNKVTRIALFFVPIKRTVTFLILLANSVSRLARPRGLTSTFSEVV